MKNVKKYTIQEVFDMRTKFQLYTKSFDQLRDFKSNIHCPIELEPAIELALDEISKQISYLQDIFNRYTVCRQ